VVEQLAKHMPVLVAFPGSADAPGSGDIGIEIAALPWSPPSRLAGRLGIRPRQGAHLLGPSVRGLAEVVRTFLPTAVYWTHSYLPPFAWDQVHARHIVEFANIEHRRSLTMAKSEPSVWRRAAPGLEFVKGLWWERRVMRRADAVVALSEADGEILGRESKRVIVAPNGFPDAPYVRSPSNLTVGAIGTWDYLPNRQGIARFLAKDWPGVKALVPAAQLVIGGRGSKEMIEELRLSADSSVIPLGFVPSLDDFYARCAIVVAPAEAGGGQQLKVTEALAHGRLVVGPPYLRASSPSGIPAGSLTAESDLGGVVPRLLREHEYRWQVEAELMHATAGRGWDATLRPVVEAVLAQ
jgi:hypothetical protein